MEYNGIQFLRPDPFLSEGITFLRHDPDWRPYYIPIQTRFIAVAFRFDPLLIRAHPWSVSFEKSM